MITISVILLAVVASVIGGEDYLKESQSFIKGCEINKPKDEFVKCMTESVQILFKQFKEGIPGLDAIKGFDPFELDELKVNEGESETVNVKVKLTNIKVHGFSETQVKESKVSKKTFDWKTTFYLPKAKINSDYQMEGRILLIPLNGEGKLVLEIDGLNMVVYSKNRLYEKHGLVFFNITDVKVDYSIEGLKSDLSNLFGGNKELEDSTNQIFNENWKVLEESLRPVITQTLQDILRSTLQSVFGYIPGQYYIPDVPKPEELYGKKD